MLTIDKLLLPVVAAAVCGCPEVVAMNYPTLMDPTAPTELSDNNYYTVGQHPYLFWASIGHSPESDGRHQWATPMTFQK